MPFFPSLNLCDFHSHWICIIFTLTWHLPAVTLTQKLWVRCEQWKASTSHSTQSLSQRALREVQKFQCLCIPPNASRDRHGTTLCFSSYYLFVEGARMNWIQAVAAWYLLQLLLFINASSCSQAVFASMNLWRAKFIGSATCITKSEIICLPQNRLLSTIFMTTNWECLYTTWDTTQLGKPRSLILYLFPTLELFF